MNTILFNYYYVFDHYTIIIFKSIQSFSIIKLLSQSSFVIHEALNLGKEFQESLSIQKIFLIFKCEVF